MPETGFERPTLIELGERATADLESNIDEVDARVPKSLAWALAWVVAGLAHVLHGVLAWLARQLFDDTADDDTILQRAPLYGVEREAAVAWQGTATFTGTNGTDMPAGTVVQRADGATYTVDATVTVAGGEVTPSLTAVDAGADYALEVGQAVSLVSPISGIDSDGEVDAVTVEGADEESVDSLRDRLILRRTQPPQGGAASDYIQWAREVVGVTAVWVIRHHLGLGTVGVFFVMEDEGAVGIPSAADVTAVEAAIEAEDANGNATRRPVEAEAYVAAPSELAVPFTIAPTPDTTAVKDAIEAQLDALFLRKAEARQRDPDDRTVELWEFYVAIAAAKDDGLEDFELTIPAGAVTADVDEVLTTGTVTWA